MISERLSWWFQGKEKLIRLNSLNIRSEIWRRSLILLSDLMYLAGKSKTIFRNNCAKFLLHIYKPLHPSLPKLNSSTTSCGNFSKFVICMVGFFRKRLWSAVMTNICFLKEYRQSYQPIFVFILVFKFLGCW